MRQQSLRQRVEIVASEVSSRPFKKLNPYAPLPNMDVEYNQSTAHVTGNIHSATNNASGVRITSPKEYSISSEATVLREMVMVVGASRC
ncbi:hypothetical protein [Pseudoalteromonas lipolytica]|uniref:hypothetical protein n=1 Tax=Pseudoalteromonas lipolytica TaxID=570156 RepID=UPI003A96D06C